MRIGIFGGSFNPVHNGHLKLAREAASELNLSRVIFVPSHQTPLKRKEVLIPAALRLKALKGALRGERSFSVSDCEMRRKGVSYTVDTLRYFRAKFPGDTLYFLSGADTLKSFRKWKSPDEVLRLARFVAASRPGARLSAPSKDILLLPMDTLDVSSTEIRRRFSSGKKAAVLVPAGALPVIQRYFKTLKTRRPLKSKSRKK